MNKKLYWINIWKYARPFVWTKYETFNPVLRNRSIIYIIFIVCIYNRSINQRKNVLVVLELSQFSWILNPEINQFSNNTCRREESQQEIQTFFARPTLNITNNFYENAYQFFFPIRRVSTILSENLYKHT